MSHTLVYGLSADPIHQAHVDLTCDATLALLKRDYEISEIVIIPVYRRNLPKEQLPAPYDYRYRMCEIAARTISFTLSPYKIKIGVSRIEETLALRSGSPNYTVETLTALQIEGTINNSLIFLISSDLFSGNDPEFVHWYQPERLIQLTELAICPRVGYEPNKELISDLQRKGAKITYLDELSPKDMSARNIRARLLAREDPLLLAQQSLLPQDVAIFIKEQKLYLSKSNP